MRRALWLCVVVAVGCAQPEPRPASGPPRYAVTCSAAGVLDVRITLAQDAPRLWEWGHGRERVEALASDPEASFEATASGVKLAEGVRELRYRYRLGTEGSPLTGVGGNGTFVVSGAAYLLRPRGGAGGVLTIEGPAALPGGAGGDGTYRLTAGALQVPGFHAFGVEALDVEAGAGRVRVALLRGSKPWDEPAVRGWVARSLSELGTVFPRAPTALVIVLPRAGEGVGAPLVEFSDPPSVAVPVGQATRDFSDAWVLLRELCRAALPEVQPEAGWIREGAATYLQHLAAWRGGRHSADEALKRLRRGVTRATAQAGRDSLRLLGRSASGEQDYATVYWGGALFMLDLDLRLRARGQRLEDVLRPLVLRRRISSADFAAEVDAVGGAGLFRELEVAHLEGPPLAAADAVFGAVGVAVDGTLLPTGAEARRALAEPVDAE